MQLCNSSSGIGNCFTSMGSWFNFCTFAFNENAFVCFGCFWGIAFVIDNFAFNGGLAAFPNIIERNGFKFCAFFNTISNESFVFTFSRFECERNVAFFVWHFLEVINFTFNVIFFSSGCFTNTLVFSNEDGIFIG